MRTKLTLRLDETLVKRAEAYARKTGMSVSQIVGAFLESLDEPESEEEFRKQLPPITRSLLGVLKGADFSEDDYVSYLEEKYR